MGFQGYKLKRKLIVFENSQDSFDPDSVYAQTFELTLLISTAKTNFLRFDEMESAVDKILERYSKKILKEHSPFDQLEPTLENMGTVFFELIKQNLDRLNTSLERLEISESPVRTFIVNKADTEKRLLLGDKKIKVASLIIENMISQSVTQMVSNFDIKETDSTVPIPSSAPVPESSQEADSYEEPQKEQTYIDCDLEREERAPAYQFALGTVFLILCGIGVSLYLKETGAYPGGADIYGHLFKSDLLYHSILKGDLYPLYTDLWYNGMQPFRYWAPLPYYLLTVLQFVAGGNVLNSYLIFVAFSIVAGGIGWLIWGLAYNRMFFCTLLGVLWFFLPDNMRVFFVEGNLPRMVIAILLPYLFYFVWRSAAYSRKTAVIPITVIMAIIILCHVMIAAMIGITTFLFLTAYSIIHKRWIENVSVICTMLLSFLLCGFWLFPALHGGLMGMNPSATSEVMQALSTSVSVSLNPFLRNQGMHEMFYFGASILGLSVAGLFLSDKKSRPGFITVVIVFCGTTTAMVPFLEKLPLNQLLWMTRFTPIVYVLFLLSLIEWKKCRRYAMIIFIAIILFDCVPSMELQRYHSQTPAVLDYSLKEAKERTNQRISLLDVSAFGSYPSFHISAEEPRTEYTFGWAWQGAATSHNIMMVNTALEKGYYYYLFDRSLELGDDTVLIRKELVSASGKTLESLTEAAQSCGYRLYNETNYTYDFKLDTPKHFGVSSKYTGLTIGSSANLITLEFPAFEEGDSQNLSDYTLQDLTKYKVVYLSGFVYDDKEVVQELLENAASNGVKIIIDMNRIPVDPITSRMTFLDVTAQSISFSNQYPELMYKNKIYEATPFKEGYETWNTVYLEHVDKILGYSYFNHKKLPFVATADNSNIIFMGYNFLFHAVETQDQSILSLMKQLVGMEPNQLPLRKIVPLDIKYQKDKIIIDSPAGKVNTTIAYQDNFRSSQKIFKQNNLLVIEEPRTEIRLVYPYFVQGFMLSFAGLLGISLLIIAIHKKRGVEIEKKIS